MNSESSNPSEKASEKLICPGIIRVFPKDHNQEKRFFFARAWEMQMSTLSFHEREGERKQYTA